MKKFAHHTLSFSINECWILNIWIFFDPAVRDLKVEMIDWNQYVSCTLKHCQLSWQQMVQCPVLAECCGAKRCWMLNVETQHCLPTCYWQVVCWWRRTGAQCVQHTPDFVNRSKVFVWREANTEKMEDVQFQILRSRDGNRTKCRYNWTINCQPWSYYLWSLSIYL